MLYREIIAVCSQIHTKHINTLCGQNVEFGNFKRGDTKFNHPAVLAYGSQRTFHTNYHQFYIHRCIIHYSSPSNVKLNRTLLGRHVVAFHSTRSCLNERSVFFIMSIATHTHTHTHIIHIHTHTYIYMYHHHQ